MISGFLPFPGMSSWGQEGRVRFPLELEAPQSIKMMMTKKHSVERGGEFSHWV